MKARKHNRLWLMLLWLLGSLADQPAMAALRLPAIISNHMVVQANANPRIWGWASPAEKIKLSYLGKTIQTAADESGKWEVFLGKLKPGTKFDLDIEGENTLSIRDVLAGEVWVCSGQSNMEFSLARANGASADLESHTWPQIRFFKVKETSSASAMDDVYGSWVLFSPQESKNWSAVGYYFAKELNSQLGEPIGMIQSARGGTKVHVWMSQEALGKGLSLGALWADQANKQVPYMPSCLYNGMIKGITPYTISGITWYQGESNAGEPGVYSDLFHGLIEDWRDQWQNKELPFLFVQLPNFGKKTQPNERSNWAELREAQSRALVLPKTGMAVTIDSGDPRNIHPIDKKPVGYRLALAAMAIAYHKKTPYKGPIIESMKARNGTLVCRFTNADKGLSTRNGAGLSGFQICGDDLHFVPADAVINGNTVVVSSSQVPKPAAIRYAWGDDPDGNLQNGCGLPAPPFRTDTAAEPKTATP